MKHSSLPAPSFSLAEWLEHPRWTQRRRQVLGLLLALLLLLASRAQAANSHPVGIAPGPGRPGLNAALAAAVPASAAAPAALCPRVAHD